MDSLNCKLDPANVPVLSISSCCLMRWISAASDQPLSPQVASALPSAKGEQICKTVLWGFGGDEEGYLAGQQLGGLEHNYKVNDLSGVAMASSWYPLSFPSKPLNYSSITSYFSVFCPSPKVPQTALYLSVFSWLRTSILFSHFHFPHLLHPSVVKCPSHGRFNNHKSVFSQLSKIKKKQHLYY